MDLLLIGGSTAFFVAGFILALRSLRHGERASATLRYGFMGAGFALQSAFLFLRGQALGRCPLTNGTEILVFVSWAVVLIYFVIGPAFHLSLLGFFTAPLAGLLQTGALIGMAAGPNPPPPNRLATADYWLEFHAAISLIAYGAFALAFVAGIMFLIQDRYLRLAKIEGLFYQLPPIHYLTKAIHRLLWFGFLLLSIGIVAAFRMEQLPSLWKLATIALVWFVYGGLLLANRLQGLGARSTATAAIAAFAFPVLTYWFINQS